MKNQSFIMGALILVIAGFINRIIGFAYRVIVVRIVGAEGIGLYEMVFPVYIMILVLATAGIPLAISKLVSARIAKNDPAGAYKIFKIALLFLFISGLLFSLALYFILPFLMKIAFTDPRVEIIFQTMIPAIFFISVSSAFRGYFQGLQQMMPTALTQTVEQVTRVIIGLYFAQYLLPHGLEYGVTGLAIGMVLGELMGLVAILVIFFKKRKKVPLSSKSSLSGLNILTDIFSLSIPITLTRTFATIILALEAIILPQRLMATGITLSETTSIYGQYSGMALPLLVLPTIITISLAVTLVPAISEAAAQKNYFVISSRINKSIQLTILVGIPSSIVFYFWGPELTLLLFNNIDAGYILKTLAIGSIFLYLQQTTSGILQGLGEVKAILRNSVIGGLIRLGGIYYLAAIPGYGITGALLAVNTSFIAMAFLNNISIARVTGISIELKKNIIKPLWCGVITAAFAKLIILNLITFENNIMNILMTISLTLALYLCSLLIFRIINIKSLLQVLKNKW
ncbi:MAG: stage V sporulation protein B [Clostridia bacterium]|nr:stage V sporulation protein B [Clostridia bacterium]